MDFDGATSSTELIATSDPSRASNVQGKRWAAGRARVSRACDRCKSRKIRCTGTQPCEICVRADAHCLYASPHNRGRPAPPAPAVAITQSSNDREDASNDVNTAPLQSWRASAETDSHRNGNVLPMEPPSRASVEPAVTDLQGHYVGPASGVALFQRVKKRLNPEDQPPASFTFGDMPLPEFDHTFNVMVSREETAQLVQRYFEFTVPVDRFLVRPVLEAWFSEFHETMGAMNNTPNAPARRAILWMVFAMAQEHMSPELSAADDHKRQVNIRYFLAADYQLAKEPTGTSLASVQARLCQCLWLLSRSRMNHCWQLFGTAARLALAIGLHRHTRLDRDGSYTLLEVETRRRTFWSAYCLDNYLSISLGRPRIFHDDDIDQEFPSCTDDSELLMDYVSPPNSHGYSTMLAPVAYFKLSRIVSMILKDLYSIKPCSTAERCRFAAEHSQQLLSWRASLPRFLNADNIMQAPLIPLFQRQRNVLNLAFWHTVVLTHRPLILNNFARLNGRSRARQNSPYASQIAQSVEECLKAAMCITETLDEMVQSRQMFRSFWFTSYFTFSATTVLYVHTIQHSSFEPATYEHYFAAAMRCQAQLSNLAEKASLLARYCLVLEELRLEAQTQIDRHAEAGIIAANQHGIDISSHHADGSLENGSHFADFGLGNSIDFQMSPENGLPNMGSWLHFEALVCCHLKSLLTPWN
ncbi:hypothetical protein IQ07DRAFT_506722 [Pyrenochaeta sp. DS3sAY3a]|nr:hypothetical protein IQ07DRAFT_506722 [Pyrenochaeta sp. DS3sAY3a]